MVADTELVAIRIAQIGIDKSIAGEDEGGGKGDHRQDHQRENSIKKSNIKTFAYYNIHLYVPSVI
jgi:hypothetical protein